MTTDPIRVAKMIDRLAQLGFYEKLFAIAKDYHATMEEVMAPSREQRVVRARHACWAYLRGLKRGGKPALSFPDIAKLFDADDSSVKYGVASHHERRRATGEKEAA